MFHHFRQFRGAASPNAKLSESEVQAIRAEARRGVSHQTLGARYRISRSRVGQIVHGQAWRHLTGATA